MPLVSIGLPVFNGERYLARAIDTILGQSFRDFELIVCDNASTDRTPAILAEAARHDERIRYVRNNANIGAAPNWNRVFSMATGAFFKWASHDDLHAPTYLERCLEAMQADPGLVLCHTATTLVDEDEVELARDPIDGTYRDRAGNLRFGPPSPTRAQSPDPVQRFRDIHVDMIRCFDIFGLMRSDVLRRTSLHRSYYGSDKALLVELALLGRFSEVPEPLFLKRDHAETSLTLSAAEKARWIDPARRPPKLLPRRLYYAQVLDALGRSELSAAEKARCLGIIAANVKWRGLLRRALPHQS